MYLWIHDNRAPQVSNSMYGRDKCFKCNNFTNLTIFSGILAQLCRNCLLVQEVVMLYWFQSLHTYFSFFCTFFCPFSFRFLCHIFPFCLFPFIREVFVTMYYFCSMTWTSYLKIRIHMQWSYTNSMACYPQILWFMLFLPNQLYNWSLAASLAKIFTWFLHSPIHVITRFDANFETGLLSLYFDSPLMFPLLIFSGSS